MNDSYDPNPSETHRPIPAGYDVPASLRRSNLALWALILAVAGAVIFLTELTSNTAVTAALLPVLASAAGALDQPIVMLLVPATLAASCAFMLPVATPPNAIVFSSGVVTIRQMARAGLWLNLAGIVVITLMMLGPGRWLIPQELHELRAQETQEASPGP